MGTKAKISTMADAGRKSGRAVFDNQGRASWEWQTATGVFETNVTHEQLQTLEAAESVAGGKRTGRRARSRLDECVAPRRAARERRRGSP